MPQIEIRPYNSTDEPVLSALEHFYKTNHVWQLERQQEEGRISLFFNEVKLPREVRVNTPNQFTHVVSPNLTTRNILVAALDHIPVGYICLEHFPDSTSAQVLNLVVNFSLRRQGIGTALLLAGQAWALQKNIKRIILEMQTKNYPAIQLAIHAGYEFSGFQDNYYPNHDIVLFFAKFIR